MLQKLYKPTCIDLILTNKHSYFQHSHVFENGLSNFHFLTVAVFKMGLEKLKPKVIVYRNYKNFNNYKFQADMQICRFIYLFIYLLMNVYNGYNPAVKGTLYIIYNNISLMSCFRPKTKRTVQV